MKKILHKKIIFTVVFAALAIFALTAYLSNNREAPEDFVKIGAILHLTGDQAEPAEAFLEGIRLGVNEINDGGGILNKKIQLFIEDDNLQVQQAVSAASKLIYVNKIQAGINASFLESMANGPTFEQNRVPVITLWDSAEDIEKIGDYIFGIGIWTPSAGEKAAEFAYNNLNIKTAVIVSIQNEWSKAVADIFQNKFKELGGTILETHSINPTDTSDFRTTIAKIQAKQPDGIYTPITDGVVAFYRQLGEFGFAKPIITSDIITGNHIAELQNFAEGIYQTQAQNPSSAKASYMVELYKKYYNKEPKQTLFIAWGYDAVHLIKQAVELGNSTDPESIKNNLYAIQNFEGASGNISIDAQGSSRTLESMFQIKKGEFVLIEE